MKTFTELANSIINGNIPQENELLALLKTQPDQMPDLLFAADKIRFHFFGKQIHLCTICNGKSGKCSEDCRFCSQSVSAKTEADIYPLLAKNELLEGGLHASKTDINRFSIVTSGGRLPQKEVHQVADALSELKDKPIRTCVSLGILKEKELEDLRQVGIDRYHHNLESSRSYFPNICSTHSFQERVDTIKAAKTLGYSICSGGIFGLGESDEHLLELALELKDLDVDSVPINFLVPIKGTPLENADHLTPLRCLQIIAFFRFVLPQKEIIICGGREDNLKELHPFIFYAGASGIMTGNYLTTDGRTLEKDLELINL